MSLMYVIQTVGQGYHNKKTELIGKEYEFHIFHL